MPESLNEILFHLIWTKDKVFDSKGKAIIPHTIIYQYYQPHCWYFTALDGTIKRKSKEKLIEEHMKKEFFKHASPSGIIAVLYFVENSQRSVEFLTVPKFLNFLTEKKLHKDMILQKFVDPQGDYNNSFSILWTTNFSLFERKVNKVKLCSENYDIYEKAVTFEGQDFHVDSTPVRGSLIPNSLIQVADSLVSHISSVTFEKMKVSRMMLQFRLGNDDKLWLLCATALRFENTLSNPPVDLDTIMVIPKEFNSKNLTVDKRNPAVFVRSCQCASCRDLFESSKVIEVSYRSIVSRLKDPVPLKNLYPRLTKDELKKLCGKPQFLDKTAWMCFRCYLEFTREKKKSESISYLPLLGTGPLNPIRARNNNGASTTKNSSQCIMSSRSSVAAISLISASALTHSSSMQKTIYTARSSKMAGGELILSLPTAKK